MKNGSIEQLLERGAWSAARKVLERELHGDPANHWLLTQLGVTYYEQRRYKRALDLFRESHAIVDDCPLTLWNLAGALDALGKHTQAIRIYRSLLTSNKSPADDPCWESETWANSLKANCVYRVGACFEHLGRPRKAALCYHQYLNVLLSGIEGLYSAEDVTRRIRNLGLGRDGDGAKRELRKAVRATLPGP